MSIGLSVLIAVFMPEICIDGMGAQPVPTPPQWHAFVPTVVIGFDRALRRDVHFHTKQSGEVLHGVWHRAGADHRDHRRARTTWILSLRWRTGPGAAPPPLPTPTKTSLMSRCREFADLRKIEPTDPREIIEWWTEIARIESLLTFTGTRGVRR